MQACRGSECFHCSRAWTGQIGSMILNLKSLRVWIFAVACSVLINTIIFGIMPGLVKISEVSRDRLEVFKQIQVIRIKKPEPPARKKHFERIRQPEKLEKIPRVPNTRPPVKPEPPNLKPRLPFQINQELPALAGDPVMPELEQPSFTPSPLKASYSVKGLDSPLMPVVRIAPVYPLRASAKGIEGYVTVQFLVTEKGSVKDISIIKAEPEHVFEKSVIRCVSAWKFKPGTVEGIPVSTMVRTTIRFRLDR